jgi:DNA polymerase-1
MEKAKKHLAICMNHRRKINKKLDAIAGWKINPGSPKQMSRLLYDQIGLTCPVTTAKGKNSTSEAALLRLRGQHEATDLLWDWRGWDKKRSTYFEPWIRQGPVLHANYGTTDTDTGRLNSDMVKNKRKEKGTGGVIHQCPRDVFVRGIIAPRGYLPHPKTDKFVPEIQPFWPWKKNIPVRPHPEDWAIMEFDWSQIELRLVAHAAEEPTMMEIFNNDGDIHLATAMDVLNLSADKIDKETRKKAKAVNFGFVYGMFAPKFQIYCLEKFDLKISLQDSKSYRRSYFKKYSGLGPWHRRVEARIKSTGFIDNVFGRPRHLPQAKHDSGVDEWIQREAVRQAINSPIQGAGSDLMLFLFALIGSYSLPWDFKIDRKRCFFVGTAHDSCLAEVHKSYVKEMKEGILWTVKNLPVRKYFGFDFRVPIKGDLTFYDDFWKGKVLEV